MIEARSKELHARAHWIALTVLTLAAFALRLALIPTRQIIENDGPYYVALAAQILRGEASGALNDYWSQLYPLLIALVGAFTQDVELAARLTSAICGAALVPAVWWLAREAGDTLAAHIAALLIATQPWLLVFSALALTEVPFTLLTVIGLALIIRAARHGGLQPFALAGGAAALAILTRPEGLLLVPFLVGAGAIRLARAAQWQSGRELAAGLGALLIIMAPQTIGTYSIYGHVNWLWKGSVAASVADEFNDPGRLEQAIYTFDEGIWDLPARASQDAPTPLAWERAAKTIPRLAQNAGAARDEAMLQVWLPMPWTDDEPTEAAKLAVAFLVLMAIIGATRRSGFAVLAFGMIYTAALFSALVHPRLLVPLVPFFLIPVALGSSTILQAARRSTTGRFRPACIPLIALAGWIYLSTAALNYRWAGSPLHPFGVEPAAQKDAGVWLREHAPQSARILSHNPQAPYYFYEGWPFENARPIPWSAPEDVLAYARQQEAEFIVIEEWVIRAGGYPVAAWLDAGEPGPGLMLRETFGEAPYRVFIYEYKHESDPHGRIR